MNNYLHLNTVVLSPKGADECDYVVTGQFTPYKNTLLQSLMGLTTLAGCDINAKLRPHENETPLFVVDCSFAMRYHRVATKSLSKDISELSNDGMVNQYIKCVQGNDWDGADNLTKEFPAVAKYRELRKKLKAYGSQEEFVARMLRLMDQDNIGKTVFASGSKKEGKVFAYAYPKWNDYLGRKAITHGNNLVSDNAYPPVDLPELTVLVVDDDGDPAAMLDYGLGDCHGLVNYRHLPALSNRARSNPFQYRGFFKEANWICKGVLRPVAMDYDLVVPLSSFKVDEDILPVPLKPGVHKLPFKVAINKPAKASWSSFGLNCQYFNSKESIAFLLAHAEQKLNELNQLKDEFGDWEFHKLADLILADSKKKDPQANEEDESVYQKVGRILKADKYGLLSKHPYIVAQVRKWLASKLQKIAKTAGIEQRYLLACPMDELDDLAAELGFNLVVINDDEFVGDKAILSRFPTRNHNDLQQTVVVNLADAWAMVNTNESDEIADELGLPADDEAEPTKRTGVAFKFGDDGGTNKPEKLDFEGALWQYLNHMNCFTQEVIFQLVHAITREYRKVHYYGQCLWVGPKFWKTFAGDFDGDYGNLLSATVALPLYEECGQWKRYSETLKPKKVPFDGDIESVAASNFANDVALLSSCSTVYNVNHQKVVGLLSKLIIQSTNDVLGTYLSAELLAQIETQYHRAGLISDYIQIAVDMFKSKMPDEIVATFKARLQGWLFECTNLKRGHWASCYKQPDAYTSGKSLLPGNNWDTVGKIISLVNNRYHEHEMSIRRLEHFVNLFPLDKDTYEELREQPLKFRLTEGDKHEQTMTIGDFYTSYCRKAEELSRGLYDENRNKILFEEDESGNLRFNSDAAFDKEAQQRKELLMAYGDAWEYLLMTYPGQRETLVAGLWHIAHPQSTKDKEIKGSASLVFYLLAQEIVDVLSLDKVVSMTLSTNKSYVYSLLQGKGQREFFCYLEPLNDPMRSMALYITDEDDDEPGHEANYIGKVFSSPRNALLEHDRLAVKAGRYYGRLRYLKTSKNGNFNYELSIKLDGAEFIQPMEEEAVAGESIHEMLLPQLREIARGQVSGWYKLKKQQLIDELIALGYQ